MKLGFQHMGTLNVALKAFVGALGCEVVQAPTPSRKSLELGARHSPEMVCLPFKATLGDMILSLERGADTLAFLGSGDWSCRFGYYGRTQCHILRKLGYEFRAIFVSYESLQSVWDEVLAMNHGRRSATVFAAARGFALAWRKSRLVDLAEETARTLRAVEIEPGGVSRILRRTVREIDEAATARELKRVRRWILEAFASVPVDASRRPLRIAIIGESYCVIEPLVNFDLIEFLGAQGVVAEPFLTAHRWLFYHTIRKDEDRICPKKRAIRLARPYWAYNTGGEDQAGLGWMIDAARRGVDGVIHVMPFGCMPETAVLPVVERVAAEHGIPALHLSLDEHSGEAGVHTRVEAFCDLLGERRRAARGFPAPRRVKIAKIVEPAVEGSARAALRETSTGTTRVEGASRAVLPRS